ncbi:MAG: TolC family protein [Robiginitomaculum sp.]
MTHSEMGAHAATVGGNVAVGQEPIAGPISLYEAMARSLKYNLEHRVAMMESDLAQNDFDLSRYDQLPQIVANAGYYSRNNENGSSSRSLLSGRESLEPSTSTERDVLDADLGISWNVLDFGLSYIRAQQLGNEALIVEERRRKAIIGIMEDVHRAYWRAASAQRLTRRLGALEGDVRTAFESSRSLYSQRRTAPMPALSYQRELNDIKAQAQKMQRELTLAKMELAALMNVPAGEIFSLQLPSHTSRPASLAMSLDEMISAALQNRPEVRESAYLIEIGEQEMKKAMLEALPGLNLFAGANTNSNDFLYNNDWAGLGAKASWNLMKVFATPARKARASGQTALEREKALATAMAVMTQVNVARARYSFLQGEYDTASEGTMVQSDIMAQVNAQRQTSAISKQTLVREQMNTIISEARRDSIHAEMQEAAAKIYTAMGYDPYAADITGRESIADIASSLQVLWQARSERPGAKVAQLRRTSNVKLAQLASSDTVKFTAENTPR